MTEAELRLYLNKLRDDFVFFYSEVLRLYKGIEPCDVQKDMAWWAACGPQRRGILAMRGIGKTEVICALSDWRIMRNPEMERVLASSPSANKALETLHLARGWLLRIPFLRHLAPTADNDDKYRDSQTAFDVPQALIDKTPSFQAIGLTGQRTGSRATFINPDDVETDENTITRDQRARLEQRFDEFEHIASEQKSEILVTGTYHHEESLYTKLMQRGYEFRTYPICYPANPTTVPGLAPILLKRLESGASRPGDPVFPVRFGQEYVLKRQLRISKRSWAMQLMLMPGVQEGDRRPLKLHDLVVMSLHRDLAPTLVVWGTKTAAGSSSREDIPSPGIAGDGFYGPVFVSADFAPYQGCVCWIDPAGHGEDELAWSIMGQLNGMLFWKHVNGVKGGATPENLMKIATSCREHGVTDITGESNFGGDTLLRLLEPIIRKLSCKAGEHPTFPKGWTASVHMEGVHSSGQKELRITSALDPIMAQHRLIVSDSVARDSIAMQQLALITTERGALDHEDRLESAAGAAEFFKDCLYQDAEVLSKRDPEAELMELVEAYRKRFHPEPSGGWIQYPSPVAQNMP
ncbi:MAG: phage terminase large subunit [bacterium]